MIPKIRDINDSVLIRFRHSGKEVVTPVLKPTPKIKQIKQMPKFKIQVPSEDAGKYLVGADWSGAKIVAGPVANGPKKASLVILCTASQLAETGFNAGTVTDKQVEEYKAAKKAEKDAEKKK